MFRQRRRDRDPFTLLLLVSQFAQAQHVMQAGTAIVAGINAYIHFFAPPVPLHEYCILPSAILAGEYYRIVTAAFLHADDAHIYFNLVSFLWKGIKLEPMFGTARFLALIGILTVASGALATLFAFSVLHFFAEPSFFGECAVGFSAVIFALKVVLSARSPDTTEVVGPFSLPSKYAAWAELILIQLVTPNASFVGHLCGIAAGILFNLGIFNPILQLVDGGIAVSHSNPRPHGRFYGSGTAGSSAETWEN